MWVWERQGSLSRSIKEIAEDIRRTALCKISEVLSTAALAQKMKKSPPTRKSHTEQPTVPSPPLPATTAQAITFKPTGPCWLCNNYGHVAKDGPDSMHSSIRLRECTNWQETGDYHIPCPQLHKLQPLNNLNAIQSAFCFGHHYGRECHETKESTSVKYSNGTKKAIRTSDNISPIHEGSNQADLNIA